MYLHFTCVSCASIFTIVLGFQAVTLVGLNSVARHPVLFEETR
jgi:hypothetical protein